MKTPALILCTALGVVVCVGCQNDDEAPEAVKAPVAFDGTADPRFAATWKSTDGRSTYQLAPDGTYKLDSKISVQGRAPFNSHLEGDWKVNGDRMLFRDKNGNTVPYAHELKGNTLTLSLTGSLKNKTILTKQ